MFPLWDEGITGFIDGEGRQIPFPPDARGFRGDFHEGLAVAAEISLAGAGLTGYITIRGEWAISPRYQEAEHFSGGLAAVRPDSKWGYANHSGKLVIAPQFDRARPFRDGLAAVQVEGKWGYIDESGEFVLPPTFVHLTDFHEERAWVIREPCPCWISAPKNMYLLRDILGPIPSGRASIELAFEIPNCRFSLNDRAGQNVGDRVFDAVTDFSEGLAAVGFYGEWGQNWGFIDRDGTFEIPPQFSKVGGFGEGLAAALPLVDR